MPMNKKEKQQLEDALTKLALRFTNSPTEPDVRPPTKYDDPLRTGWTIRGSFENGVVTIACTSSLGHGVGSLDKTTSRDPRPLYSTKLRALKAQRRGLENMLARRLRIMDIEIEDELQNPTPLK